MKQTLIVVIYDGINNSVFNGQVLQPLAKKLAQNADLTAYLVSFESSAPSQTIIDAITTQYTRIRLVILKKIPYIGCLSLIWAAWQLKKVISNIASYTLHARGPLAGYICAHAQQPNACQSLLIQARGLLAEEYEYAHAHEKKYIQKLMHHMRYKQFLNLEKKVYAQQYAVPTIIEAVSPTLKEYLITTFGTSALRITIAEQDLLAPQCTLEQRDAWKKSIRALLEIPLNARVYCYNGSIKPWQCPQETITYFLEKKNVESHAFLLVLTQDQDDFTALIKHNNVPVQSYRVLNVSHNDIYRYLAACDIGLIFRHSHIINWTSRPTKILEYRAVGLSIEHNNTVAWLTQPGEHMLAQSHKTMDSHAQTDY